MSNLTDKPAVDLAKNPDAKEHSLEENVKEHSLQSHAKERAENPTTLNAGTAFDWEDLEAYQEELKRLDQHPPQSTKP